MPSSANKQRLQDDCDTAEATLSCVNLTDRTAAACFRGLALASHSQAVLSLTHQRAVDKLRLLCDDLITKKSILEPAEKPTGKAHEFRDRAEEMLRAAGSAYAKAIAKAQTEMMVRVLAEQQAIAEKRGRIVAEDRAEVPDARVRAQPLRLVARRAADVILFRKRQRPLSDFPEYRERHYIPYIEPARSDPSLA